MVKIHNINRLLERRKKLRLNQTPQEEKLWWYLKNDRLGVKFRRQHSIGGYILDFYCKEKRLIIEVDGEIHYTKKAVEYDRIRDKFFSELDYEVLRFPNTEVDENINDVVIKIREYINKNSRLPSPDQGEGNTK